MSINKAIELLGKETFDKLKFSVPRTRSRGRLMFWQEKIFEAIKPQLTIQTIRDFEKIFGKAFDQNRKLLIKKINKQKKTSSSIEEALKIAFPSLRLQEAREALEEYEDRTEGRRIHKAILALSYGEIERLKGCVELAKKDYRDVLMAAEYSGSTRVAEQYLHLEIKVPLGLKEKILGSTK